MSEKLNEAELKTDRWTNRAVSPLSFSSLDDIAKPAVIVHPGWGKKPELFKELLLKLADAGMRPIGVDTRFGYADRFSSIGYKFGSSWVDLTSQYYRVGTENPFFKPSSSEENRYRLRRPTGLAAMLLHLGIEEASFFGHSEGGRIVSTVVTESTLPLSTNRLVIANSVGTGPNQGIRGMAKSNAKNNEFYQGHIPITEALASSLGSVAYALTHPRRFSREKAVIDNAGISTWDMLDVAALEQNVDVTVYHAIGDHLISFLHSQAEANKRPHINFLATQGGHSNVYTPELTDQLVHTLAA